MVTNEEKEEWHCLAIKELSALLHRITSKNNGDFYCLNYLHSFRTENKLKYHEKLCKNKDLCGIIMPSEKHKILQFDQYMKSDIMSYIIYADIESLIRKTDECANNPEKSSTMKIDNHIPYEYSMSKISGFDHIVNKHTFDSGKDCIKKFCNSLREHAKTIIDFEKKKKKLALTKTELKSHRYSKACYICGRKIHKKFAKDKNYQKVRDHCYYTAI